MFSGKVKLDYTNVISWIIAVHEAHLYLYFAVAALLEREAAMQHVGFLATTGLRRRGIASHDPLVSAVIHLVGLKP